MLSRENIFAVAVAAISMSSISSSLELGPFPVDKPDVRYIPWSQLTTSVQDTAGSKMGYSKVKWNVLGFADIEKKGWWEMTLDEIEGATELNFTEEIWDCWIHHYDSYTWAELEEFSIDTHYTALGWTEASWQGGAEHPASEAKWWGQLTDEEKSSAHNLCYFEDNWNKEDMTPNDGPFPYPMPEFRYVPWNELTSEAQNISITALSYDEESWNNPFTALVEAYTYFNLDESEQDGAFELGFYPQTWDCFQNHYLSYFWGSFYGERKTAIETLGWTEESWNEEIEGPETESKYWEDLTDEEQDAAMMFCYFRQTWDAETLGETWEDVTDIPTSSPIITKTESPTAAPVSQVENFPTSSPDVTTGSPTDSPVILTTSSPTDSPVVSKSTSSSPTDSPVILTTSSPTDSPVETITAAPTVEDITGRVPSNTPSIELPADNGPEVRSDSVSGNESRVSGISDSTKAVCFSLKCKSLLFIGTLLLLW